MSKEKRNGRENDRVLMSGASGSLEEFMSEVDRASSGGSWANLKKAKKLIGYIHKRIGFSSRLIHASSIPSNEETDSGVVTKGRRFNCAGDKCAICGLVRFAKEKIEDGADPDMRILDGGKKGIWKLKELAQNSENYQKDLSIKTEFLIPLVLRSGDRSNDSPVQILTVPVSLGRAIKKVIASEMEDRGEKGHPLLNPYPFKFTYDKDAEPAYMYGAQKVSEDVAPMDEETEEIMSASADDLGVDLDSNVKPGNVKDMMYVIGSTWDCKEISFDEFEEFMGMGKSKKQGKKNDEEREREKAKARGKKNDEDDIDTPFDEEREWENTKTHGKKNDEDEDKPKVKCPDCGKRVVPDKKDRCPNCRCNLEDVPY